MFDPYGQTLKPPAMFVRIVKLPPPKKHLIKYDLNGGTVTNTGGYKAIYKKSGASATIKGGSVSSKNW